MAPMRKCRVQVVVLGNLLNPPAIPNIGGRLQLNAGVAVELGRQEVLTTGALVNGIFGRGPAIELEVINATLAKQQVRHHAKKFRSERFSHKAW